MSQLPEKFEGSSASITDEQKAKLKLLFPEIITEGGKIDFERLRLTLGESVDVGKERYGMNWPGKADCFKTIQKPSMATLVPARDESVNFDTTENLIIEGDNLETLKLLQKAYLGKVKMIYIDPPYNTGNDFIYPDDYSESLDTYLRYTGQADNEGRKYSTNTEADGRFHTKWMNMMYPRLFLARNLLREDGAIFISIDGAEQANLRAICNEIFGEENFIDNIVWDKKSSAKGVPPKNMMVNVHEYIVAYKNGDGFKFEGQERTEESGKFKNPDNDPRGPWRESNIKSTTKSIDQAFTIVDPNTGREYTNTWAFSKESLERMIKENRILWKDTLPKQKEFMNNMSNENMAIRSNWGVFDAQRTTVFLKELIPDTKFDNPKPISLMDYLIKVASQKDSIILDFFAGSGSTAQAVLETNKEDNGNRKFILVQLPEPIEHPKFKTIADIAMERVRQVIHRLNRKGEKQLGLEKGNEGVGFKAFKLRNSNFKAWNAEQPKDDAELVKQLTLHVDHLVVGRTQEDVLYELLLKSGFPLDTKVEKIALAEKSVFSIADGAMLICLEKELTPEVIKAMAEKKPERVVCLDAGFADNDQLKTNAVQTMKSKGVTKFQTV